MGTDVEVRDYRDAGIDARKAYAQTIATADDLLPRGLRGIIAPGTDQQRQGIVPGKVLLVLETGRMLGIDPMAALQGINVIEGAASIAPALMQALVRRAGHKLRVDITGTVAGGDIAATARLTRLDEPDEPYVVTWDVWDAVAADLVEKYEPDANGVWTVTARSDKGNKLNWEKYTRQMLKWRAQSEVVRDGAEDVLMGVHYSPDELGVIVAEDGSADEPTSAQWEAAQDAAIARIRLVDDRANMGAVRAELIDGNLWTAKVEAEFAAHLITLPDSRPARAGAPGQTGDPRIDGLQKPRVVDNVEEAVIVTDDEPSDADAPPADEPEPAEIPAPPVEPAEPERDSDGMIPPGAALRAARAASAPLFDASALGGDS